MILPHGRFCLAWFFCVAVFGMHAASRPAACATARPLPPVASQTSSAPSGDFSAWQPLIDRLSADGLQRDQLQKLFSSLGADVSPAPMGTKAYELYRIRFLRPKTPPSPGKKTVRPSVYQGVVTPDNIKKARVFMKENKVWLDRAHRQWGVPPEVVVGLLLVETRLGTYLGANNAFETLAHMSASRDLAPLLPHLKGHVPTEEESQWLQAAILKKAEWAYEELRALIEYALENNLNPLSIPASIYGAIGLCQFMPSNIKRYGRDGNGNGQVNLFAIPDAIASVGNYLRAHGWKTALTRADQIQILKKYNNSTTYANTIMAIADQLDPDKAAAAKKPVQKQARAKKRIAKNTAVQKKKKTTPASRRS